MNEPPYWARINIWPQFIIEDTDNYAFLNLLKLDPETGYYSNVGRIARPFVHDVMAGFYEGHRLGSS